LIEVVAPSVEVTLFHASGESAGIDLHDERKPWCVEGPDGEACLAKAQQRGHSAERPGTYRTGASDLEDRLRANAADGGYAEIGAAEVLGEIGAPFARSAPEEGFAGAEPVFAFLRDELS